MADADECSGNRESAKHNHKSDCRQSGILSFDSVAVNWQALILKKDVASLFANEIVFYPAKETTATTRIFF